jgi:hypothetical protein
MIETAEAIMSMLEAMQASLKDSETPSSILPPTHLQIHSTASILPRKTRSEHHSGLPSSGHPSRLTRHEVHRCVDIDLPSCHWRCYGLLQSILQRRFRLGLNTTANCAMFLEILGCCCALDFWHLFALHAVVPVSCGLLVLAPRFFFSEKLVVGELGSI